MDDNHSSKIKYIALISTFEDNVDQISNIIKKYEKVFPDNINFIFMSYVKAFEQIIRAIVNEADDENLLAMQILFKSLIEIFVMCFAVSEYIFKTNPTDGIKEYLNAYFNSKDLRRTLQKIIGNDFSYSSGIKKILSIASVENLDNNIYKDLNKIAHPSWRQFITALISDNYKNNEFCHYNIFIIELEKISSLTTCFIVWLKSFLHVMGNYIKENEYNNTKFSPRG